MCGYGELLFWVPGQWEIIVVGGLIVLVFFGNRIPEAMRSLGRGITQFRKGLGDKDTEDGDERADKKEALPAPKEGKGGADEADTKKEKPADAAPGALSGAGQAPGPSEPDSEKKDGPAGGSSD